MSALSAFNTEPVPWSRCQKTGFIKHRSNINIHASLAVRFISTLVSTLRRASKPPDLAGDPPIFLRNNENLPTSRFVMKISRFISRVDIDSRLALSIADLARVGKMIFSLLDSLVDNIAVSSFIPRSRYIRPDTPRRAWTPLILAARDPH